jgi:predicted nucleotidyltransferase
MDIELLTYYRMDIELLTYFGMDTELLTYFGMDIELLTHSVTHIKAYNKKLMMKHSMQAKSKPKQTHR